MQRIKGEDVEKYNEFIMLGFNTIMNRWQQQASLCNSFIEREKSYQDFIELYENFKDYLPIEVVNMLKQNLEEVQFVLQMLESDLIDEDREYLLDEKSKLIDNLERGKQR